mmetsp:Transcript_54903/g.119770  ORF Transcript_54903/g.119770 Transcript_54903/m.119770 type:complete len:358 (-) Transcript_54903:519-1592(-)|eukprot:2649728-Pleurochrysis_carterae.AAC.3
MFPAGQGERSVVLRRPQDAPFRMHLSKEAKLLFRAIFRANPYPSTSIHRELAAHFGLTPKSVQLWFQNQRQRNKGTKLRGSACQSSSSKGNETSMVSVEVSSVQVDAARAAINNWRGFQTTNTTSNIPLRRVPVDIGNNPPNGPSLHNFQCWSNAPQLMPGHQEMTGPLQMPASTIPAVSQPPAAWQQSARIVMSSQPSQRESQCPMEALQPVPQYNRTECGFPGHNVEVVHSPIAWTCQPHYEQQRLQHLSAECDFHSRFEQAGWTYVNPGVPGQPFGAMQWAQAMCGNSFHVALPLPLPPGAHGHEVYQVPYMPNFSSPNNSFPQPMDYWPRAAFQSPSVGYAKDTMSTKSCQPH